MGQANACIKLFLIAVNLLFLLMGIVILGVGIYLCTDVNLGKYSELLESVDTLRSVRVLLIVCGCFATIIGMCGCVGACKENRCLLAVYLILLVLILFINLAAVILAAVHNGNVKSMVGEQIQANLKRHYGNLTVQKGKLFTEAIDKMQREDKCCGWSGLEKSQNFFTSTPWHQEQLKKSSTNPAKFPESCCGLGVLDDPAKKEKCLRPTDEKESRNEGYIHASDCLDNLVALNGKYMYIVLGTVILAILLQILCIICAVVICRQIKSGQNEGRVV